MDYVILKGRTYEKDALSLNYFSKVINPIYMGDHLLSTSCLFNAAALGVKFQEKF